MASIAHSADTFASAPELPAKPNCKVCALFSRSAWVVDIAGLELKPSFGGNGLGYSSFSNDSSIDLSGKYNKSIDSSAKNTISNVQPKWSWGLGLGVKYYFQADNSAELSWYHLGTGVDKNLPTGTMFAGNLAGFYAGEIQLYTQWNAVNIGIGHIMRLADRTSAHVHAGVAFAKINNRFLSYPRREELSSPAFVTSDTLSYSGFGPRFMGELAYDTKFGPSFYLAAGGSLLVGSTTQSTNGFQNADSLVYGRLLYGTANYSQGSTGVVVPEFEAKLGTTYDIHLGKNIVHFNVGYLWIAYLNVMNSYTGVGLVGSSAGAPTTSNFDLNGMYLGFQWRGDDTIVWT
jgi:hypothetical protein